MGIIFVGRRQPLARGLAGSAPTGSGPLCAKRSNSGGRCSLDAAHSGRLLPLRDPRVGPNALSGRKHRRTASQMYPIARRPTMSK